MRIINIFVLIQKINFDPYLPEELDNCFLCLEYVTIPPVKYYLQYLGLCSASPPLCTMGGHSFLSMTTALSIYLHPHYHAILYF